MYAMQLMPSQLLESPMLTHHSPLNNFSKRNTDTRYPLKGVPLVHWPLSYHA